MPASVPSPSTWASPLPASGSASPPFSSGRRAGQLLTGALSDRWGRKRLIVDGMLIQAVALAFIAATRGFLAWSVGAVLLGVGTAMVYPTLLAVIGDVSHPSWRASSLGVYRLW